MKKRWMIGLLCLIGLFGSCSMAEAALPDLQPFLNVQSQQQMTDYAYSSEYVCNVWFFPRNSYTEAGCGYWLLDCLEEGFTLSKTQVEGYGAYIVKAPSGPYAMLLPDYGGTAMLMVETTLPYAPALPTATPAPRPVVTPAPQTGGSGGHWESVTVEKDCPSCTNGSCSICHGTGVYRLYGQAVDCDRDCASCDGKGTYESTQLVWVYD